MTQSPALCPSCRKRGVIATAGGPTCQCAEKTGAAWFPDWWHVGAFNEAATGGRVRWLVERQLLLDAPRRET